MWQDASRDLLTWVADPLYNLLRLDHFGRQALSREQVQASNWFGGILGLAIGLTVIAAVIDSGDLLLVAAGGHRRPGPAGSWRSSAAGPAGPPDHGRLHRPARLDPFC